MGPHGRRLPLLHSAAKKSTLRGFRFVFKAGMRYFPRMVGVNLVFRIDKFGDTPLRIACKKHGTERTWEAIENALIDCCDTPYDTADALLLAATDHEIDLDGVYFMLRREPDVLAKLLSPIGSRCL